MARKLSEQKVLESLIHSHILNLEYLVQNGHAKGSLEVVSETITIGAYIARYRSLENHPPIGKYLGRMSDIYLDKIPESLRKLFR